MKNIITNTVNAIKLGKRNILLSDINDKLHTAYDIIIHTNVKHTIIYSQDIDSWYNVDLPDNVIKIKYDDIVDNINIDDDKMLIIFVSEHDNIKNKFKREADLFVVDNIIQNKTKLSDIESKLNIKYATILYLSNLSYDTLNSYNVICQDMEIIQ
jgi:hypothetical protein